MKEKPAELSSMWYFVHGTRENRRYLEQEADSALLFSRFWSRIVP